MVQRKSFNHSLARTARTLSGVRRMAVMLLMMLSTTITLYAETILELTCVVNSDLAADADMGFTFTISLDDKTVNGTYGNMTFVDGVAIVTLKGGESVSATDLAKGIGYEITEDYADGFDLTTEGETGTISDNKSTATFTNTRKTSSGSQTTTYGLSTGTSEHGTLSLKVGDNDNATSAAEGAEVIVTVNAATGWQTSGVTAEASTTWDQASARRRTGSTSDIPFANITPTKVDGTTNQWRFTMPPANVTVSATYKKVIQASWIQDITAVTYNGTGQTPTVTVKDGTTTLVENTDYTVSYSNNVNAALSTATTNAPTVTITAVATSDKYAGTATKTFTISPKDVTVTAKSEAFTYDGTAHSNAGYDVEGLVGSDAISAVVEGSITFPRESPVTNTLKSYSFTTGTAGNYSVTTANGQLTMTNASVAITITAASQSWTYDGIAHTNTTVTLTSGALFTGDELVAEATGSVTDVADTQAGNNPVKAGYKVMHGTEDVTANYVITAVAGKLTVNQKSVTVTAQDKEFTYNGEAQTWNQYDVDGLVGSDQISAVVEGSITFPSQNPVANTIKSYNFTTGKPGNYSVTTADGELTMTNASVAITITAASQSWTYDGNAHTNTTVTVTDGSLFTGDQLEATATGSVTNVADTQADNNPIATGYKVLHGSEDVTANYVITAKAGTLTITEATINVTAKGWSGTYDGQKHSITVTAPSEATVKYGTEDGTYDLSKSPLYTNAGSYTVYYQVTRQNFVTVTGSEEVEIEKAEGSVIFNPSRFNKYINDEDFTVKPIITGDGELTYRSTDASIATVDRNTGLVSIRGIGTVTIYADLSSGQNYTGNSDWYLLNISKKQVDITVGSTGRLTFCSEDPLDFTTVENLKAYIVVGTDFDKELIWLSRVLDVPAGLPVLIIGKEGNYSVPCTISSDSYYKNKLVGNTSGSEMRIEETDGGLRNYYLKDGQFLKVNEYAKIGSGKCYLQLPAEPKAEAPGSTQSILLGSTGKTTLCADVDLDFTEVEGLKAYVATGYNKAKKIIWLSRVKKVSAGTPLLLKGKADKTYSVPSSGIQTNFENMLVGNTGGSTLRIGETTDRLRNYYLKDGQFHQVNEYANIASGKCYLQLPYLPALTRAIDDPEYTIQEIDDLVTIGFANAINGSQPTGIDAVDGTQPSSDEWYNLQGQRVENPGKGLYIRNGKKIAVK